MMGPSEPEWLNLRAGRNGLAANPRLSSSLRYRRRVVLFIHGYNNNEKQARKSYLSMLSNMLRLDNFDPAWLANVYAVYWPGDLGNKFLSLPTYNWQIGRANASGQKLAELLGSWQRTDRRELVIVAHSLGCRVALETLRSLRVLEATNIDVLACVLMAGAVQENECEDPRWYAAPTARRLRREVVLYSKSDRVLRIAFPVGQTARLDQWGRCILPRAVGLEGGPRERWNADLKMDMHPFGHSDYWKNRSTADVVSQAFGRRRRRLLKRRELPGWGIEPAEPLPASALEQRPRLGA